MNLNDFWSYVDRSAGPEECWPWTRTPTRDGYGRAVIDGNPPKWELAHRTSYRLSIGPIPDGLNILHSCDNPPCCNPRHLRPGTHADNLQDSYDRGRRDPRLIARVVTDYVNGERSGMSKMTASQVLEIRRRLKAGESQGQLSKIFPVGQAAISSIALRKTWKHI
jgi:hypothetical protein